MAELASQAALAAPTPAPAAKPRRPSAVGSVLAGLSMGLSRAPARAAVLTFSLAAAMAALAAFLEREAAAAGAVDRALEITFRLVVPLMSFGLATTVIGPRRLQDAAWPAARFGASGGLVAFGMGLATAIVTSIASVILAAVTAAIAAPADLATELPTCLWIAALTGLCYAGWLSLGSTFLRGGRGRMVPLVVDFLAVGSAIGNVLPAAHALNLLGLHPIDETRQEASSIALPLLALATMVLAAVRCRNTTIPAATRLGSRDD